MSENESYDKEICFFDDTSYHFYINDNLNVFEGCSINCNIPNVYNEVNVPLLGIYVKK